MTRQARCAGDTAPGRALTSARPAGLDQNAAIRVTVMRYGVYEPLVNQTRDPGIGEIQETKRAAEVFARKVAMNRQLLWFRDTLNSLHCLHCRGNEPLHFAHRHRTDTLFDSTNSFGLRFVLL